MFTTNLEPVLEIVLIVFSVAGVSVSTYLVMKAAERLTVWTEDMGRAHIMAGGKVEHETYRLLKQVGILGVAIWALSNGSAPMTIEGMVFRLLCIYLSAFMFHTSVRAEIRERRLLAYDEGVTTTEHRHEKVMAALSVQTAEAANVLRQESREAAAALKETAATEIGRLHEAIHEVKEVAQAAKEEAHNSYVEANDVKRKFERVNQHIEAIQTASDAAAVEYKTTGIDTHARVKTIEQRQHEWQATGGGADQALKVKSDEPVRVEATIVDKRSDEPPPEDA